MKNNVVSINNKFSLENEYSILDLKTDPNKLIKSVEEQETLDRWVQKGFPRPYPVMNKKHNTLSTYQTYYKVFGRTLDDGKVRLQSKYYNKLLEKMKNTLNLIDNNLIQVVSTDTTIIPLLNEFIQHLKASSEIGDMSPESVKSKGTLIKRLGVIINSDKKLSSLKINKWTSRDLDILWKLMFSFTKSRNTKRLWLNLMEDTFGMALLNGQIPRDEGNLIRTWRNFDPNKKMLKRGDDSYNTDLENTIKLWDFNFMREFINSIEDKRFRLAILIAVYCGLRVGEIFGLEFADFEVKPNHLRVSGQTTPVERSKIMKTKTPRGLGRLVPMPPWLYQQCKEYIKNERNNPYAVSDRIMFPNCHKGVWDWHNSSSSRTALENVMVGKFETPSKVRYHFFRHWIATQWIRNGIYEMYDISYMLGHKNMSITARVYAHVFRSNEKCDKEKFLNGEFF